MTFDFLKPVAKLKRTISAKCSGSSAREAVVAFDPADRVRAREHRIIFPEPGPA